MASLAARRLLSVVALAIAVADAPPTEFRIFAAGENSTTKGTFLFDKQAADSVMAAYRQHGVDVMIDLEHLSLEQESRSFDPDARGWCKLELRNGELWATDVTWTPDGAARLTEKRQRYISPVFEFDGKTGRIVSVLNIAITALPATDQLAPLVAARDCGCADAALRAEVEALSDAEIARLAAYPWDKCISDQLAKGHSQESAQKICAYIKRKNNSARLAGYGDQSAMSPEQLAQVAEALGLGADANVEDVLATIAAMVKKVQDAANGDGDPEDKAEAPEGAPAAMQNAAQLQAASRTLARLSGKKGIAASLAEVEVWRDSHIKLEQEQAKLARERATLESDERRRLVGELVKCGAETPAFAWAADAAGVPDGKTPASEYASMPIERLRAKVAARAPKEKKTVRAAEGADGDLGLTDRELEKCKARKIDPKKYAANKAAMTGQKAV